MQNQNAMTIEAPVTNNDGRAKVLKSFTVKEFAIGSKADQMTLGTRINKDTGEEFLTFKFTNNIYAHLSYDLQKIVRDDMANNTTKFTQMLMSGDINVLHMEKQINPKTGKLPDYENFVLSIHSMIKDTIQTININDLI